MNKQTKITPELEAELNKLTLPELLMAQKAAPKSVQAVIDLIGIRSNGYGWKKVAQARLDEMK